MTSVSVLGSGSRGNAVAISTGGQTLLVDAGFSSKELRRRAEHAGVELSGLCGIALTHEHHDHARGALRLAEHFGVPVLASPGTWAALRREGRTAGRQDGSSGGRTTGLAVASDETPRRQDAGPPRRRVAETPSRRAAVSLP